MAMDKARVAELFRRERERADRKLAELTDVYRGRRLVLGDPITPANELAAYLSAIDPGTLVALVVHTIMTRAETADAEGSGDDQTS